LRKEGDPIMQTIPFATFEDLRESVSFIEYADGLRSYVREWYYDVFLDAYNAKTEPDSKIDSRGQTLTEKMVALTTEQLADATYQKQNKKFSTKQILETFVYPLLNQGYIDVVGSDMDKRSKIYYPVIASSKNRKLFDSDQSNNFSQENRISIMNLSLYPTKEYLISKIRHVLKYSSEKQYYRVEKIVSHDNREISIEELVDTYYNNPENHFQSPTFTATNHSDQKEISDEYLQNGEIASELQIKLEHDTGYIDSNPETCEKLFDDPKSNNFLFPCYYCDYHSNVKDDYERHVVLKHPGKLAYPGKAYLERLGIEPKGKMYGP
jgi:hypothetical protein